MKKFNLKTLMAITLMATGNGVFGSGDPLADLTQAGSDVKSGAQTVNSQLGDVTKDLTLLLGRLATLQSSASTLEALGDQVSLSTIDAEGIVAAKEREIKKLVLLAATENTKIKADLSSAQAALGDAANPANTAAASLAALLSAAQSALGDTTNPANTAAVSLAALLSDAQAALGDAANPTNTAAVSLAALLSGAQSALGDAANPTNTAAQTLQAEVLRLTGLNSTADVEVKRLTGALSTAEAEVAQLKLDFVSANSSKDSAIKDLQAEIFSKESTIQQLEQNLSLKDQAMLSQLETINYFEQETSSVTNMIRSFLAEKFPGTMLQDGLLAGINALISKIPTSSMTVERAVEILNQIGWEYQGNPFENGIITKEDVRGMIQIKGDIPSGQMEMLWTLKQYQQSNDQELSALISELF